MGPHGNHLKLQIIALSHARFVVRRRVIVLAYFHLYRRSHRQNLHGSQPHAQRMNPQLGPQVAQVQLSRQVTSRHRVIAQVTYLLLFLLLLLRRASSHLHYLQHLQVCPLLYQWNQVLIHLSIQAIQLLHQVHQVQPLRQINQA